MDELEDDIKDIIEELSQLIKHNDKSISIDEIRQIKNNLSVIARSLSKLDKIER